MPKKFKEKTIPDKAHPFVQRVFQEMNAKRMSYAELSRKSGVKLRVLERWRTGVVPQLQTLTLVMKVLDLNLHVGDDNA